MIIKIEAGSVKLFEIITYSRLNRWYEHLKKYRELKKNDPILAEQSLWSAIFSLTEEVKIKGYESMNAAEVPTTPRAKARSMVVEIIERITAHIQGEEEVPKD